MRILEKFSRPPKRIRRIPLPHDKILEELHTLAITHDFPLLDDPEKHRATICSELSRRAKEYEKIGENLEEVQNREHTEQLRALRRVILSRFSRLQQEYEKIGKNLDDIEARETREKLKSEREAAETDQD